ncbi:cobalamin B12-binding domain-containing protein [Thermofilum pendens]|uniref:Monomethylamine corrinoid protein n=1 Tax=Thermofilum pendens (strain DSM 2475 / Hrk 5) TaxID=368408 RepID=A1RZI0_THEPD|nr:corrinoid protein [Thermofilum pendens]ABL78610.1 monomethylamine corrinoid protein [Thermofilum pendens Hrk 5]
MDCRGVYAEISRRLADLDAGTVERLVSEALEAGCDVVEVVEEGLRKGMVEVGVRFERGEYFLPELVEAGDIFNSVMEKYVLPRLKGSRAGVRGRVVIGTVRGDIHDIGKNLVATMLRVNGFEVVDLGVDVPPERFVEAVEKYGAEVVGMSALLTTTMLEMRNVIDALKAAGLRDKVKVIVGGAPVTEEIAREIGADAYGRDAVDAVEKCAKLVEELRRARASSI